MYSAGLLLASLGSYALSNVRDFEGCGWSRCVNCTGGPCGPSHQKCIASPSKPVYTFHLADPTCDINDPNGPMYDPVHGVYHNFYQIHIAEDQGGAGDGPDWGHWVSRDFLHWAQLPVAIWNDRYYDNSAIYTGSTTIVNGKPVMMYPGKCNGNDKSAKTVCNEGHGGYTYVLTVPKDPSDPLYTEWTKEGEVGGKAFSNPVVNNTGDDPSTAWKTKDGEWRIIGNQGCAPEGGNPLYGSMDFVEWYKIGCTTLMAGDCPTFFPLPKLTPGSEHYLAAHLRDAPLPNYVHKSGGHGGDQVQVGQWADGKPGPGDAGGTVGTWAITAGSKSVLLDRGNTHASKDFYDPVKKRQILWVWGTVPSGIQTLPREMTYHPGFKQIVYSPVEEMATLRTKQVGKLGSSAVPPAGLPLTAGSAVDIEVFFAVPKAATTLAVDVGSGRFFLAFTPSPGGGAWYCECGWNTTKYGAHPTDNVPLLPDDAALSMRIFLDGPVAEAYFMGGRVAMTVGVSTVDTATITSSGAASLINATSFELGDIHTTTDAVLATPRMD